MLNQINSNVSFNYAEKNKELMERGVPLSITQLFMVGAQMEMPQSTRWNIPHLLKFAQDTDMERLKKAIDTVMAVHPAFSIIYTQDENEELIQKYIPGKKFDTVIEEITEAELKTKLRSFIKPFEIFGKPLYRLRLFQTENCGYLFFDFHHSMGDGTACNAFIKNICLVYEGKQPIPDYYFAVRDYQQSMRNSPRYKEAKEYYDKLFEGYEMPARLKTDFDTQDDTLGTMNEIISITNDSYNEMYRLHHLSKNAFFITVTCIVIAAYNERDNAVMTWLHNGRQTSEEKNVLGLMYTCFTVGMKFNETKTLADVYSEVKEQIRKNKYYSCFIYPERELRPEEYGAVDLNYLHDMKGWQFGGMLSYTASMLQPDEGHADYLFDIEITDNNSECCLCLSYNASAYKRESVARFKNMFMKTAKLLMENIEKPELPVAEIINQIKR